MSQLLPELSNKLVEILALNSVENSLIADHKGTIIESMLMFIIVV